MNRPKAMARALLLSYITVGYNLVEGLASVTAGILAGSVALLGFALDSFFESISGAVMVWRLRGAVVQTEDAEEKSESTAVRDHGRGFSHCHAHPLSDEAEDCRGNREQEPHS